MLFLVEQDQLFVLGVSERRDVEGAVRIDQDDLVADEGRSSTKGCQGVVAARTWRDATRVPFGFSLLVVWCGISGAGLPWLWRRRGPGTAELILILNSDDRCFLGRQCLKGGMAGFGPAWFATSLRRMMNLGDGQLKRIVHFKLFVAVESLSEPIEKGIQPSGFFLPFSRP